MTDIKKNNFCMLLEIERNGKFVKKLFRLNPSECILEYFSVDAESQKLGYETRPDGSFHLHDVSLAGDASSLRPKVQNCFYIVVSGQSYFLKAATPKEKETWIEKLQDASRIVVPEKKCSTEESSPGGPSQTGYKVEVVGGVILKTPMDELKASGSLVDESSSDESLHRSISPSLQFSDEETIKCGHGVKQGVFRKSWKNRFLTLSSSGLRYSKSSEDRVPIRVIKLSEIMEARISFGIHLNREFMFEVVTPARVFYIQVNSVVERDSWINAINKTIQDHIGPKRVDVEIQTDMSALNLSSSPTKSCKDVCVSPI